MTIKNSNNLPVAPSTGIERDFTSNLELSVILEEYKSIRGEIDSHETNQHQVINFAISFLAAGILLIEYLLINNYLFDILRSSLLIGALVFLFFSLIYLWHDTSIIYLAAYINHILRPRLEEIISKQNKSKISVLLWDDFQNEKRFGRFPRNITESFLSLGRYGVTIIPSFGLLLFYVVTMIPFTYVPVWQKTIFWITSVIFVLTVISSGYVAWLFFNLHSSSKIWKKI